MLADAQGQPPYRDQDQRRQQDGGDPHGDAQHDRRQIVLAPILIGGVDQDDQGRRR